MGVQLIGIGTAVPEFALSQSQVKDLFLAEPDIAPPTARLIRAAYDNSAIERRHTVIEDLAGDGGDFLEPETHAVRNPGTGTRNARYAREAPLPDVAVDEAVLAARAPATRDVSVCVVLVARAAGGEPWYRYLCGEGDAARAAETWSSSKMFAAANAAGRLRDVAELAELGILSSSERERLLCDELDGFWREQFWRERRLLWDAPDTTPMAESKGFGLYIGPWQEFKLARFRERQAKPFKRYKITDEDWRNRERWDEYQVAASEMIARPHSADAPWHVVNSEDKKRARIEVLKILNQELDGRLKR